jgi:hypothetical protein
VTTTIATTDHRTELHVRPNLLSTAAVTEAKSGLKRLTALQECNQSATRVQSKRAWPLSARSSIRVMAIGKGIFPPAICLSVCCLNTQDGKTLCPRPWRQIFTRLVNKRATSLLKARFYAEPEAWARQNIELADTHFEPESSMIGVRAHTCELRV